MDGLMLSADRGDTSEPHRIVRLADIYARIVTVAGAIEARCGSTVGGAIVRLHDGQGSLTVLWSCRACAEVFGGMVDSMWSRVDGGPITHVTVAERAVLSGTDETWRDWGFLIEDEIDTLYDMPSPSDGVH